MQRPSRCGSVRFILALLLLSPGARSSAIEPLVLDGRGGYRLDGLVSLLRDPGSGLDALSAEARAAEFASVGGGTPNLGFTSDAIWLRFELRNPAPKPRRVFAVFEYPVADSVALSVLRAGAVAQSLQAGDSVPASAEMLPSRYFAFPVDLGPAEEIVCLIRARSSAGMSLPLRIFEERELARAELRDALCYGLLLGCLVLLVLYLLASPRHEPWLLWFCAYAFAFGLHVAIRSGYSRLLLGERGYLAANFVNVVAIGLLYFTGAAFFRSFLGIRERSRILDAIMIALQYLALAFIPLSLVPGPALIVTSVLVNLLGPLFSISLAFAFWMKRVPNAGLFAVGWLVPHAVAVADFLRIYAILPYSDMERWMLPGSLGVALLCLGWAVMRRRARDAVLARVDALTGLANRRRFDETLLEEWSRARRFAAPLALLMIDIDDFKRYNDARGHRAGDQCLRDVSAVFALHARRAGDLAARYGGEEFTLLLPNTKPDEALRLAERVRASVQSLSCRDDSSAAEITVSIGVAARVPVDGEGPEGFVGEADAALYRAKESGKNRVCATDPSASPRFAPGSG
jgi:diguanylate cyclase (GGDEF)-like protein